MLPITSIVAFIAMLGVSEANNHYENMVSSDFSLAHIGNSYQCQDGKVPREVTRHTYINVTCYDNAEQWLGDQFHDCDIPQTTAEHYYEDVYAYDSCCQMRGDRYINGGVVTVPPCSPITPH